MAMLYYNAVKSGKRTIDKVPARWRAAVQAMLDADEASGADDSTED